MSNLATVSQQILDELDKPNDSTYVKRAIVEALRYLRDEHLWINESRTEVATESAKWNYPLPTDFLKLIGQPLFHRSGSTTSRRSLRVMPPAFVEEYKYLGADTEVIGDWTPGLRSGPPHSCAIFAGELLLIPIPDADGDIVTMSYLRDLGTPIVKYASSTWSFYEPDGVTPLPTDYSNEWFTVGQDVLRTRAIYMLQQNNYKNLEGAQLALAQHVDARERLHRQSNNKQGGGTRTIRGYL